MRFLITPHHLRTVLTDPCPCTPKCLQPCLVLGPAAGPSAPAHCLQPRGTFPTNVGKALARFWLSYSPALQFPASEPQLTPLYNGRITRLPDWAAVTTLPSSTQQGHGPGWSARPSARGQGRTHSYRGWERLDCPSLHRWGVGPAPLPRGVGHHFLNN